MAPSPSAPEVTRPARALLAALLVLSPVVFWYSLLEPFEACKSTLTQLAALALLVLAAAACLGRSWAWRWQRLRALFAGPVGVAVLAAVASAVVSTICSISPRTSLQGALDSSAGLGSALAAAVLFAASRAVCTSAAAGEELLAAAVVGAAVACGYALVQALGGDPVAWEHTSGFSGWLRPSGTQGHPNYLAGLVVMTLPAAAWLLRRGVERRQTARALAAGLLAVMMAGTVVMSLSRAAWLAGGVVAVVLLVGWRAASPRVWALMLLAAPAVGLAVWWMPGGGLKQAIISRVQQQASSPARGVVWKSAWGMFLSRPWAGSGVDTFGLAYPLARTAEYWEVEWGSMPTRAHNDLLHALATQGLPGGVAYLLLPAALLLAGARRWRERGERPWLAVLGAVVAAYYVQNLFGFTVASTSALLAVVAGMIAAAPRHQESETPHAGEHLAAASVGVAFVLAGLWQGAQEGAAGRLALTAAAMAASIAIALATVGGRISTWRPPPRISPAALIPAAIGIVAAWHLLCPLVASHLSYNADLHPESDAALAAHDRAVRLAPGHAILHGRRARALLRALGREGDADRRERLLRASAVSAAKACELEPLAAHHHGDRAGVLLELARQGLAEPEEVLAAYDRAVSLDRCDWCVLTDAARAATTLGRFAAAERYVARGLAEQPQLGMLHAERGALELARGRVAEAEATLQEALAKEWHGDFERLDRALLLLATALLHRGDAVLAALTVTDEVLGRHADWVPAWWLHALARERLGQRAAALREYRLVLERQPSHAQARAGVERLTGQKPPGRR